MQVRISTHLPPYGDLLSPSELPISRTHAEAIREVRHQLGSTEDELRHEQRLRVHAENAAAQTSHAAAEGEARWRVAAAEGWLAAGREAKRRQKAQLKRMSDMLVASSSVVGSGGGGGPVLGTPHASDFAPSPAGVDTHSSDIVGGVDEEEEEDHWRRHQQMAMSMVQHAAASSPYRSRPPSLPPSHAASPQNRPSPVGPARARPSHAPRVSTPNTQGPPPGGAGARSGVGSRGPPGAYGPPLSSARPQRVRYEPGD